VTTAADCQNCGAALAGRFCSACGQKADVRILSLPAFLRDVFDDLWNADARIWRSLRILAFEPGRLTRLYLEGQRAKFTPPFRMYLITSVTFFVTLSLVQSLGAPEAADGADQAAVEPPPLPPQSEAADSLEEGFTDAVPAEQRTFGIVIDDDDLECTFNPTGLTPAMRERLEAACERVEQSGPAALERAFADNFTVTMLVFIPIVAAIMKLLYLFARRKYVEHLLFFVHVHTFFFLVALVTVLLSGLLTLAPAERFTVPIVRIAAGLYFFVYLYQAMREVYRQGHGLTTVKYVVLGGSYFAAAILTVLGAVFFTAMTL
jgi:hypothetical protein